MLINNFKQIETEENLLYFIFKIFLLYSFIVFPSINFFIFLKKSQFIVFSKNVFYFFYKKSYILFKKNLKNLTLFFIKKIIFLLDMIKHK